MKKLLRKVQYLYCLYAWFWFFVTMLIMLPFVFVFSLFGKIKSGNLLYIACNYWARFWYALVGIRHHEIYEQPHDKNQQFIFVANHTSYMDIPATVRCMHQPVRILGKYEMVNYPLFGIIYRMAVILVDRRDADKRAKSIRALKAAIHHGISIFIFPEGSFNQTGNPLKDFYDGAFRVAIETQTPIKPLLFVDSMQRLHYSSLFSLTPGPLRVVFMEEIDVAGYTLQQLPLLKQKVYTLMEAGLSRYINYPIKP